MLCCIQNVTEKTLLMSERTLIVFIDYSKAVDDVNHIQVLNMHNDMGYLLNLYNISEVPPSWSPESADDSSISS